MKIERFSYPVTLTPDEVDGGYVVTFSDIPEAITQGDSEDEAFIEAEDCLEEAIAAYMRLGRDIPLPSKTKNNQPLVVLSATMAGKAILYLSMREKGIDNHELASIINCSEKDIEKLLDPKCSANLHLLQSALSALGKKLVLTIQDAA